MRRCRLLTQTCILLRAFLPPVRSVGKLLWRENAFKPLPHLKRVSLSDLLGGPYRGGVRKLEFGGYDSW